MKESSRGGRAHDRFSGKGVAGVGRRRRARSWLSTRPPTHPAGDSLVADALVRSGRLQMTKALVGRLRAFKGRRGSRLGKCSPPSESTTPDSAGFGRERHFRVGADPLLRVPRLGGCSSAAVVAGAISKVIRNSRCPRGWARPSFAWTRLGVCVRRSRGSLRGSGRGTGSCPGRFSDLGGCQLQTGCP